MLTMVTARETWSSPQSGDQVNNVSRRSLDYCNAVPPTPSHVVTDEGKHEVALCLYSCGLKLRGSSYLLPYLTLAPSFPCSLLLTALGVLRMLPVLSGTAMLTVSSSSKNVWDTLYLAHFMEMFESRGYI